MNNSTTQITIYIDKLSPFSKPLEEDLLKAGIQPLIKRVDEDKEAVAEMYNLTHTIHTPVIKIITHEGETVLVGYSPENKKKIAEIFKTTFP